MLVEEDTQQANKMVLAAKNGKWDDVYTILNTKPYLINMIPEGRTWAALHQAVWWGSEEAVKRLLYHCKYCDPLLQTKPNSFLNACLTPTDLARDPHYPRLVIEKILSTFIEEQRQERFSADGPYFITAKGTVKMSKEGLPLLFQALVNYKQTIRPNRVDLQQPFHQMMEKVAAFKHRSGNWLHAKEKIASTMRSYCMRSSILINEDALTEDRFYQVIVELYTKGGGRIHHYVSAALRRESISKKLDEYKPEGDEEAIAPYTLMLDTTLFCWKWLMTKMFDGLSYRGVGLSRGDTLMKYRESITFVWLQVVSSTKLKHVARDFGQRGAVNGHYVLFKIDNSTESFWQPRDIVSYSAFPTEGELLYPVGAEFKMQKIESEENDGYTKVHLKLVSPPAY